MALSFTGVQAEIAYSNDFTGGAGDFTITNTGAAGNGWAFDTACPSSQASGHSAPDSLRWGNFADCNNYASDGHTGVASTPSLTLTSECTLSFNYLLDFAEGPTFDNADVQINASGTTLASVNAVNGGEALVSSGAWTALGGIALEDGSSAIDFIGTTPDLTANTGAGFLIDDVVVDCPAAPTPATSGWGVFVLMVGMSVAIAAALFRLRRRSEVRGL